MTQTTGDTLHRLVKQAMDSGECASVEEAEALFRGYRLHLEIDAADARSVEHQVTLLTAIALAKRVFLGGVTVDAAALVDVPRLVPLPLPATLGDAVTAVGASAAAAVAPAGTPTITIGRVPRERRAGFQVRTTSAGWRGGIVPAHVDANACGAPAMPLASMLSAALAVNEAFFFVRDGAPSAGRRSVGFSLWQPSEADWLSELPGEPQATFLPSRLWLIGLGHLGQAFLWGLGLLPYPEPGKLSLVLQDGDVVTPSSESTSILTDPSMVGEKKTRAMAAWAARRGFQTTIVERLFDASTKRRQGEPSVALCGIDNPLGRRQLDDGGFDAVVEVGLGRGFHDFRRLRLHTLPGPKKAVELWGPVSETRTGDLTDRAAYRRLLEVGSLDQCGVTLLAGKAVGAPFVGAVAAALALAEVLRLLHGAPLDQMVDLDLQCAEHRTVVLNPFDFSRLNPGYVRAEVDAASGLARS